MLDPEKYFEDLFDSARITTLRLYNCCANTLNILTAANKGGEFTNLINDLQPVTEQLGTELGDMATSIGVQKGGTLTNDAVMAAFKIIMSSKEGVIRDAFGGKNTPGYLLFYPQGISQYSNATKTNMPTLVQQVFNAAEKYKADLSPNLVATLQDFKKSWEGSRDAQQQLKGDVKNNIADKSGLRPQLSIALTKVVHGIAYMFPGNVKECMSYFSFGMLYPPKHHRHEKKNGDVLAGDTVTVVNETMDESTKVSVHNPTGNAAIAAWLAADEKEVYTPGKGIIAQPGKTENGQAVMLGNLENTFLRITNLSDVNEGRYEIDIS